MINLIEVSITAGILNKYNLMIIPNENICYLNNKKYSIEKEIIDRILALISLWEIEYGTKDGIDLEEFTTTDSVDKIHGKGIYPNNYKRLLDIIGEING